MKYCKNYQNITQETQSEQRVLEKMVQTDLSNTGLPQILNVQKMQYPQNTKKQSAIKRGMPVHHILTSEV